MKAIIFIAGMVTVGAIGGFAYGEYDRVTDKKRSARAHVLLVTKVYEREPQKATAATIDGVKKCAAELHFVEMPPVLATFIGRTTVADYEIVKRHGSRANEYGGELEDLRNELSNEYYDDIDEEVDSLSSEHAKRVLKVVREFQTRREGLARCIHEKAFVALSQSGDIQTR